MDCPNIPLPAFKHGYFFFVLSHYLHAPASQDQPSKVHRIECQWAQPYEDDEEVEAVEKKKNDEAQKFILSIYLHTENGCDILTSCFTGVPIIKYNKTQAICI